MTIHRGICGWGSVPSSCFSERNSVTFFEDGHILEVDAIFQAGRDKIEVEIQRSSRGSR